MDRTDNKEFITFVWFDSKIDFYDDVEKIQKRLREINDDVVVHTEIETCIHYIKSIEQAKIILISSISDAPKILSDIENLSHIESIFVFDIEKVHHEQTFLKHSKLMGIYDELDTLCLEIQEQVNFIHSQMVRFSFFDHNVGLTQDLSKQTTDLLWFQLEQDVILQIPGNKQEMIDACRLYYRVNPKVLEMIDHFKNEYRSDEAIQTYLKKSFLYKIVKKSIENQRFR
ncbi:unnamed protein product [Rotaria magnacalcarata]